jgi:hypothetical protein
MAGLLEEEGFSFPICCSQAAPAIQMQMQCNCCGGIGVLFSLLLLLPEKLAQHKKKTK